MGETTRTSAGRSLRWIGLFALVAAFLILPSVVSAAAFSGTNELAFPDQPAANSFLLTKAVGLLVVVVGITVLRWWPPVLIESLRTRAWVWLVPAMFIAVSLITADYRRLLEAGPMLTLTLVIAVLCIAAGEELLFRGVMLHFLRLRYREIAAAVGSSVVFGLLHFIAGPGNVVSSVVFGYLLYLSRRVSGGILVPIAVHFSWNMSVFSSFTTVVPGSGSDASFYLAVTSTLLLLVVVTAHRRIDVGQAAAV